MIVPLPEAKTYLPGPGRCIYCYKMGQKLGREHIVARKLGGKLVLHAASCDDCARTINSQIETPALGKMWVSPRAHLGLPSSKPKTTLQVGIWNNNGESTPRNMGEVGFRFAEIPLDERMFAVILPQFLPPGILVGREQTENFVLTRLACHISGNSFRPAGPGERWGIFEQFSPDVFCRFLAKVAHGAAVAELGLNSFEPFLPDLIRNGVPYITYLTLSAVQKSAEEQAYICTRYL